jgi:hypothetical protein
VTSFEVVTSQATMPYLNITTLIDKPSSPGTPAPACWCNGTAPVSLGSRTGCLTRAAIGMPFAVAADVTSANRSA